MKKSVINLGGNLYHKDGTLYRKAPIKAVTIPELEQMIDECPNEGYPGSPDAKNNMIGMLWGLYNKYGNPHEAELIERLQKAAEQHTTSSDVQQALEDVDKELTKPTYDTNTNEEEYVEYEEAA